jgi:hypothetical protein
LLPRILARVGSTHNVGRAAFVSRGWRYLWVELPEIHIHRIDTQSINRTLRMLKAARDVHDVPRPDLVDVASMGFSTRQSVTALLQRIADLAPKEIRLSVRKNQRSKGATVRLPRLDRTKSIVLNLSFFHLKLLLDDGDFPALERLVVEGCYFDAADMLHRCPHLRVLELRPFASLKINQTRV